MAKAAKETVETMADEIQNNVQSSDAPVLEIGTASTKEKIKKAITSIDDLPGVGPSIAAKLRDAGYDKLETLAYCMPSELQEISGVGEGSAIKVINAARDALEMGFETGADVLERRKLIEKVTTGSLELDNLIGGGIESLHPDEQIMVLSGNGIERKKIGELVDEEFASAGSELTLSEETGVSEVVQTNSRNLQVLSFDKEYAMRVKPITGFVKHKRIEDVFEVRLSRGKKISVTAGHSLFALEGSKIVACPTRELKVGDFVAVPKKVNVLESQVNVLNLIELFSCLPDEEIKGMSVRTPAYVEYAYANCTPLLKASHAQQSVLHESVYQMKYEQKVPLVLLKHLGDSPVANSSNTQALVKHELMSAAFLKQHDVEIGSHDSMRAIISFDSDLAWLLGFITAEGGMNLAYPGFGLSQRKSNPAPLQKALAIFERMGLKLPLYERVKQKETHEDQQAIVTENRALWLFLSSLGLRKDANQKRVPQLILSAGKDKVAAFLQGLFEGDGLKKRGAIGWCTGSKELADDLVFLLHRMGEIPVHLSGFDRKKNYRMHNVFAFGLKDIAYLGQNCESRQNEDVLPLREYLLSCIRKYKLTGKMQREYCNLLSYSPKRKTVEKIIGKLSSFVPEAPEIEDIRRVLQCDLRFEKVTAVERLENQPEYVYDLSVTDYRPLDNFTTGSFVLAHNTQAITELYGKFGSGKCISKNTPLLYFNPGTAHLDGIAAVYEKYKTEEIPTDGGFASVPKRDVHVMSLDANGKMTKQKIQYLYKEFVNEIAAVKTNRGTVLETTKNHPLLTFSDEGLVWKPVGMLSAGDYIASAKQLRLDAVSELTPDDGYFFGLFVAEGTANPLSITNFDEKIINKVVHYIEKKFGASPTVSRNGHLVLLKKPVQEFLGPLAQTNSATKHVPESVLNASDDVIAAFLAGYFDGDACVSTTLEYTTKSKTLSEQIPYLLSRLGIEVTLSMKGEFYRAHVTDPKSRKKLASLMSHATKSYASFESNNHSSDYGIPAALVSRVARRIFVKISGSHRSNLRLSKKSFNPEQKTVYLNYLAKTPVAKSMTSETLGIIVGLLENKIELLKEWQTALQGGAGESGLLECFNYLPFKTNDIAAAIGLKNGTLQNYLNRRRIPVLAQDALRTALIKMIDGALSDSSMHKDLLTLRTLLESTHVGWEKIVSIEEKPYSDFVYDLTVEGTHNFVGGVKPMFLHNSQIGFQLCVNAQLPKEKGGLGGSVAFIDTESTFRPERISQMAEAKGLDPAAVLQNIHVARALNSDHQMLLTEKLEAMIKDKNVRLIVVDSLTAAFRADYIGRGELAERQQKLNQHIHLLLRFADQYNLAVYVTNQVMDKPDVLFGDPTMPIGGHVLAHTSTYRLYVRRSKEDRRIVKLVDSPNLPDGEVVFRVTPEGIVD